MTASRSKHPFIRWLPTILWASLIFYLSSRSDVSLPGSEFMFKDKVAHFFAYWFFCALVLYGAGTLPDADLGRGIGLLAVIMYGFLDEIHQKFVPGRCCDANDFLADAFGAVVFFALFYFTFEPRKRKRDEVQVTQRHT